MRQNLQHKIATLRRHVKTAVLSFFFLLLCCHDSFSQKEEVPEELSLMVVVPRVGSTEISALVHQQKAYLSITGLFDYLKIKNSITPDMDSVSGFFLTPSSPFTISKTRNKILFGERLVTLPASSLLRTETDLYLRSDYFGKIFGLDCEFEFRSLSINLKTNVELPVIREMQLEAVRKNISKLKGEKKADTTIGRRFPLLRLGTADWNIYASQAADGKKNTRFNFLLGAALLGGEAYANLNIIPGQPFHERMQSYRWRYVNNDNNLIRQVSLGKFSPEATSTLTAAVRGFQLTNTPTTYRKSFGTYILSNTIEPGWTVELYVNNILIDYTKADASGFYTFEVPMVYGNSNVKLRFYSPWGEERTTEENIAIPFNFLPEHQFEYTMSGGVVSDEKNEKFARLNLKYGLGRFITLGGGMEYFSAVTSGNYMPYASVALRLFSNIVLYSEHTYGVRSKLILNYRHPSKLQVDINYTKHVPGQKATKFAEERNATFSMPLKLGKYTAFSRLTLGQVDDFKQKATTAELLFSTAFFNVNSNFNTFAILNKEGNPLIRSNLSLTFRLLKQLRLTQQVQYDYVSERFSLFRTQFEKNIFKIGHLTVGYEKNTLAQSNGVTVGLRLNFSGVQAAFYALRSKESATSTYQSIKGSLLYDDDNKRLAFSNQSSVGRGGISMVPFLDVNGNGKRDPGEQKLCGLKVKMNGGRIKHCNKDTTIQATGLEAYTNYLLEIEKMSFDNVAWQVRNPLVNVVAEPSYFKTVEIPVAVVSEAEGKVTLQSVEGSKGQGRMIVRFYKEGKLMSSVMTEADGYFNYMGFTPGHYTAEIDAEQLKRVGLEATPATINFTIHTTEEGELISNLNFVLKNKTK